MKIKYYIQIIILLLATNVKSQDSNENSNINVDSLLCERAKIEANKDLGNDVYKAFLQEEGEG